MTDMRISVAVDIEKIADQIPRRDAEALILAIDKKVADYDFTFGLIKKLVASLRAEHEAMGETFDVRELDTEKRGND